MSLDHLRQKLRAIKTRQQIAALLANTPVGQLTREVDRISRTRSATRETAERLRKQLETLTRGANREAVAKTAVSRQIEEIERYSKNEGGAWNYLRKTFGPVADAIRGMLRPSGKQYHTQEMEKAAELLNALGVGTDGANGRRVSVDAKDPKVRADAERVLRSLGFSVDSPPAEDPQKPWSSAKRTRLPLPPTDRITPAMEPDPTSGMDRRMLGGMFVYFRPDDPIVTGEMVRVTSSNVHSIGFDWNDKQPEAGTLKVRYLDSVGGKKTGKGGATYHYYDVHPRVFIEFQKAASKGKFVWDRLRVRGTVSGHQYRYGLARISSSGYVPRQATRIGDEEWYLRRRVTTEGGASIQSQLRDQMVRKLTPENKRQLSRGPQTGRPRDGRANNGRPGG